MHLSGLLAERFPDLVGWMVDGWIEIGPTDWTRSFIRVMDEGGMVWEGEDRYASVEDAFADADRAIRAHLYGE